jgi:lipoprotein-anchoring transpeptidase ErfK/SrfK
MAMKPVLTFLSAFVLYSLLLLCLGNLLLPIFSHQEPINPATITGTFDPLSKTAVFNNTAVNIPSSIAENPAPWPKKVLGQSSSPKRIEVDLTNQRLYAYEGDRQVYNFLVSTGKWAKTPTGQFWIWGKFRYVLMKGGSKVIGTYYYLPNVPYTMFFYNAATPKYMGYGIHGTYWHHNFGHPMSHGCINLKTDEAELLYAWAMPDLGGKPSILATADNPGTEVDIYGSAPNN